MESKKTSYSQGLSSDENISNSIHISIPFFPAILLVLSKILIRIRALQWFMKKIDADF